MAKKDGDNLRADLDSVIDRLESEEGNEAAAAEEAELEASQTAEAEVPAEEDQGTEEGEQLAEPVEPPAEKSDRIKPPIDWSPELKEQFKALPEKVRKAIHDNEVSRAKLMQDTASDRRVAGTLKQIIEPFRPLMAAEGVQDPMVGIQGLLNTTAQLAFGNPQQKAHKIAQLIAHYRIDIETLDSILSGQQPQPNAPQQASDPRIDAIWQRLQEAERSSSRRMVDDAHNAITQFAQNPKNEFFDDVRHMMGDFLDVAARNGQKMTLQEAYQRACAAHPEVSAIIERRKKPRPNKAHAASSISGTRGGGSANPVDEASSLRGAIEAAWPEGGRI